MQLTFDINKFNDITSLVIATINGLLFLFYYLILILYIRQYKTKDIISFLSIQLLISNSSLSLFYLYWYIRTYNKVTCSLNAIILPTVTTTTICLLGYIPFVSIRILTAQLKLEEKFTYYAILSIILCWCLPLVLYIVLFVLDIQTDLEIWTICTFRNFGPKYVNYSMYFVICVFLEFIFCKVQRELKKFIKEIKEKTK